MTRLGAGFGAIAFEHGRERAVVPSPELTLRRGAGEGWDVGARIYLAGLEVGTRHRLARRGPLALAALPSLELAYTPVTNNTVELLHARSRGLVLGEVQALPRWAVSAGLGASFGVAGPWTVVHGYTDGSTWLFVPQGIIGVAHQLRPGLSLRFELGGEVPFALGGGRRRSVGHLAVSASWGD